MAAAIPLMLWTARNAAATASSEDGVVSISLSASVNSPMCSRPSLRNRSTYFERSSDISAILADDSLDRLEHAAGLERLDHEILCASLDGIHDERLLSHRAAHYDACTRIERDYLAHGIDPPHIRHHNVHRDEIGAQFLVLCNGFRACVSLADNGETSLLQDVGKHGAHEDGVIAYQS